jgi:hypothetical protein
VAVEDAGVVNSDVVTFAAEVVRFEPGPGAGFGQANMPDIVLGPPTGGDTSSGSVDVVSLGAGGTVVLRMGAPITNADGPDLLVYENAFYIGGDTTVFAEPGQVSVSADDSDYVDFPCDVDTLVGCAGKTPAAANAQNGLAGDVELGGGDAFDLAEVGLNAIEYIRITDVLGTAVGTSSGFDLDAVSSVRPPS